MMLSQTIGEGREFLGGMLDHCESSHLGLNIRSAARSSFDNWNSPSYQDIDVVENDGESNASGRKCVKEK